MEEGRYSAGVVISPLLANIYLYYVFDLWVDVWRKKCARGDPYRASSCIFPRIRKHRNLMPFVLRVELILQLTYQFLLKHRI
jgi:hypothetical protein